MEDSDSATGIIKMQLRFHKYEKYPQLKLQVTKEVVLRSGDKKYWERSIKKKRPQGAMS